MKTQPKSRARKNARKKASEKARKKDGGTTDTVWSISARLPRKVGGDFSQWAADQPQSTNFIISRLVEQFMALPDEHRQPYLAGAPSDPMAQFADLVERLFWATHAMDYERWVVASNELIEFERIAVEKEARGLRHLAWYLSGYCWLGVACDCRAVALKKSLIEGFDASDEALRVSLSFNKQLSDAVNDSIPTVLYNQASAHALRAQFLVERFLEERYANSEQPLPLMKLLRDNPRIRPQESIPQAIVDAWKELLNSEQWKDFEKTGPMADFEDSNTECLGRFHRLADRLDASDVGSHEIVEYFAKTSSDPDFLIVRVVPDLMMQFEKVCRRIRDVSALHSFGILRKRLPEAQRRGLSDSIHR